MKLLIHPEEYVIAWLPYGTLKPSESEGFFAVMVAGDGTTIVCRRHQEPLTATVEAGWQWVEVPGPFTFQEVGILRQILQPLDISIFAVSTFARDHIFVKHSDIERAVFAWKSSGLEVEFMPGG